MIFKDLSPQDAWLLNIIIQLKQADIPTIIEHLKEHEDCNWTYSTFSTYAKRLEDKGYIRREKKGKRHILVPKLPKTRLFDLLMSKIYGSTLLSDPGPIVNYLMNVKDLSNKDVEKLKCIVESFEDE